MAQGVSFACKMVLFFMILSLVFANMSNANKLTGEGNNLLPRYSAGIKPIPSCSFMGLPERGFTNSSSTIPTKRTNDNYDMYPSEKWASWEGGDEFPELEIPDKYYFEFTQENINVSRSNIFYALWSLERQQDPAWNQTGEWKLFNSDFANTRK
jgi:hypothetical protein